MNSEYNISHNIVTFIVIECGLLAICASVCLCMKRTVHLSIFYMTFLFENEHHIVVILKIVDGVLAFAITYNQRISQTVYICKTKN